MPFGKKAGVRCIQLTEDLQCAIFNDPGRPAVCKGFKPEKMFCGDTAEEARIVFESLMEH
jgi:hypothetical protein